MCTLSWQTRGAGTGYRLLFNRDEQKDREPAEPPAIDRRGGVRFIAPRDGRAGGTWILANDRGLCVALLNHYEADRPPVRPADPTSRGRLVLELATCEDVADVDRQLPARRRAGRYPPFLLFAADRRSGTLWRWDGGRLERSAAPPFLTTSSVRTAEVAAARRRAYEAAGGDLAALHRQHDPADPAASIRMRRDDAQTVSRCEVEVSPESVLFRYTPESRETLGEGPSTEVSLPLHVARR